MPRVKHALAENSKIDHAIASLSAARVAVRSAMEALAPGGIPLKNCHAVNRRKAQREMLGAISLLTDALRTNGTLLINAERAKPAHPSCQ
jgi:anti-sigma factor RsiW